MATGRKRCAETELDENLTDASLASKKARKDFSREDGEYNNPDCVYPPNYDLTDFEWKEATNNDMYREVAVFSEMGQEIPITDDRASQQYVWDRLPLTPAQKIELIKFLARDAASQ
jgi:uncharacterized membrane protein